MISVIISCYNGEPFLGNAIQSVIDQTYCDWELIIVNDGSTDNSLQIAEVYAKKDKRIRVLTGRNRGLNGARNLGVSVVCSNSEYLLFFDADDILEKKALSELYDVAQENNAGAVCCNYRNIDSKGNIVERTFKSWFYSPSRFGVHRKSSVEKVSCFSIYSWAPIIEPMTLIKKELFERFGPWDECNFPVRKTYGESIPLFLLIALDLDFLFIDRPLYLYRIHPNQITQKNRNIKLIQRKIEYLIRVKMLLFPEYKVELKNSILFAKYRLPLFKYINGSLKHDLRYKPIKGGLLLFFYFVKYIVSLRSLDFRS